MTDATHRPTRRRLSRRALRAWAWVAGVATFASPAAALAVQPKPAPPAGSSEPARRPVVVLRTVTRRVIVEEPARPSGVRYVAATGSTTSTAWASTAPAPQPAPATTTGGS